MKKQGMDYRGRPLLFLFGFIGTWGVARLLLFAPSPLVNDAPLLDPSSQQYGRSLALIGADGANLLPLLSAQAHAVSDISRPQFSSPFYQRKIDVILPHESSVSGKWQDKPCCATYSAPATSGSLLGLPASAPYARASAFGRATPQTFIGPVLPVPPRSNIYARQAQPLSKAGARASSPPAVDRLVASSWLLWRTGAKAGSDDNGLLSPRYGDSQTGLRLAYQLGDAGQVALYGRATAALAASEKDVAIGAAVKPFKQANVAVAIEYRQRLEGGGRNGPAIMAYGGFGPTQMGLGWTAEGYAQAGLVGVNDSLAFADGSVRIKRPLIRVGDVPVSIGAGAWGGAQKDSQRLDIGPTVDFDLSSFVDTPLRASVDWRERVAGAAVPDSGVAVTFAADF